MASNKGMAKIIALGTVVAAGAGYLAGILTAPKSGKETRAEIAKNATKARVDGEKQLKKLHSELDNLIIEADKRKTKASSNLKDATEKGKAAKNKARELLSALHDGDVDDPNLQAVIEEVKLAKNNLIKFLKK